LSDLYLNKKMEGEMTDKASSVNIDDAVLVQQCREGSNDAMEHLILKYQNRIYNAILRICGNVDDAAELTQDTFVKVIENIDSFAGRSRFYTWAFRIAVNLTLNYCKRKVKLGLQSLDAKLSEKDERARGTLRAVLVDENSPDPVKVAADNELCDLVVKAMMNLDDEQRSVMVLRDIEGMSYNEIAEVLELELGTVKSRLSRARSNLREIIEAIVQ